MVCVAAVTVRLRRSFAVHAGVSRASGHCRHSLAAAVCRVQTVRTAIYYTYSRPVSAPNPISQDDFDSSVDADERVKLTGVAARLIHERPAPLAAFRAHLRQLANRGSLNSRPAWLWPRVSVLVLSSGGLFGLVGLGLAGSARLRRRPAGPSEQPPEDA